jgi:OmpA-OmpF porin, OOP family
VMALDRDDSYGETDLYISRSLGWNKWSAPQNAGREINTRGFESGPSFSPDGTTLYFSSTGLSGYGAYDLFSATVLSSGGFSGARNLGKAINSDQNEQFFVLHPDGVHAYFTSDRAGTDGDDVFEIRLAPVDTGITFTGKVTDGITGSRIVARFEFELLPSNIKVVLDSSSADGSFEFVLPYLAKYQMRITSIDHFPVTEIIGFDRYAETRIINRDISMVPLRTGKPIDLVGINFETGSAQLTESSRPALNAVRDLLVQRPLMKVEISGHTDNVGESEANRALSLARAEAVVRYLVDAGIDQARMIAKGFGETKPVASNHNEKGREANRRVEFSIIDPKASR